MKERTNIKYTHYKPSNSVGQVYFC